MQQLEIPVIYPCLNDYIHAIARNKYAGNSMKRQWTELTAKYAKTQLKPLRKEQLPVTLKYTFFERNRRRDKDNIASFAMKTIQDGLVAAGIIENDGWKHVGKFECDFCAGEQFTGVKIEIYGNNEEENYCVE